jgi:hypothetical protein
MPRPSRIGCLAAAIALIVSLSPATPADAAPEPDPADTPAETAAELPLTAATAIPDTEVTLAPRLDPTDENVEASALVALPNDGVTAAQVKAAVKAAGGDIEIVRNPKPADAQRTVLLQMDPAKSAAVAAKLVQSGLFQAVDYKAKVKVAAYTVDPDDPMFGTEQWNLKAYPGANFQAAWGQLESAAGPEAAPIALIDTGFDLTHPDKGDNIISGYDYVADDPIVVDEGGHGTQMGGVMAAKTNNGIMVAGAAWDAKVIAYRVGDYYLDTEMIANAVFQAVDDGAKVISMSFGSEYPDSVMHRALDYAFANHVVLVGAAGNEPVWQWRDMEWPSSQYPGNYPPVITVGGRTPEGEHDPTTLEYEGIDVAAPSTGFMSLATGGGVTMTGGTSAATAGTSAAASLVLRANPYLSAMQVRQILFDTARDVGPAGIDDESGHGMIDAAAAMTLAKNTAPSTTRSVMITNVKEDVKLKVLPGQTSSIQVTAVVEGDTGPRFTYSMTAPDGSPAPGQLSPEGLLSFTMPSTAQPGDQLQFRVTVAAAGATADTVLFTATAQLPDFAVDFASYNLVAKAGSSTALPLTYSAGIDPANVRLELRPSALAVTCEIVDGQTICQSMETPDCISVSGLQVTVNCAATFAMPIRLQATYLPTGQRYSSSYSLLTVSRSGKLLELANATPTARLDPLYGTTVPLAAADGRAVTCSAGLGEGWELNDHYSLSGCDLAVHPNLGARWYGAPGGLVHDNSALVFVEDPASGDAAPAEVSITSTVGDHNYDDVDLAPGESRVVPAADTGFTSDNVLVTSWMNPLCSPDFYPDFPPRSIVTVSGDLVVTMPATDTPWCFEPTVAFVDLESGIPFYQDYYIYSEDSGVPEVTASFGDPGQAAPGQTLTATLTVSVSSGSKANLPVSFTLSDGLELVSASTKTNSTGKATVSFKSSKDIVAAIAATVTKNGVEYQAGTYAKFTSGQSHLHATLDAGVSAVIADGASAHTVTARVFDENGQPADIPAGELTLASDLAGSSVGPAQRVSQGVYQAQVTSTQAGTAHITAHWADQSDWYGGLLGAAIAVQFVGAPAHLSVWSFPQGPGIHEVYAVAHDEAWNQLDNVRLKLRVSYGATLVSGEIAETSAGEATWLVDYQGGVNILLTVALVDAEDPMPTETVVHVPSAKPTALRLEVTGGKGSFREITATLTDADGAPVTNADLWMWADNSPGMIQRRSAVYTDSKGQVTAEYWATSLGKHTVGASATSLETGWQITSFEITELGCLGKPEMVGNYRVGQLMSVVWPDCPQIMYVTWFAGNRQVGYDPLYVPTEEDLGKRIHAVVFNQQGHDYRSTATDVSPRSVRWYLDVGTDQRFYTAINFLASNHIASAQTSNDYFFPERALTRGEFAAYLYRIGGRPKFTAPDTPTFTDVPKTHMFYAEIEWMKATGLTSGKGAGTFKPADPVTRGEMAAFLHRFDIMVNGPANVSAPVPHFKDVPRDNTFYFDIEWMLATGLASPNTYFYPTRECLRDEFAAFVSRYLGS